MNIRKIWIYSFPQSTLNDIPIFFVAFRFFIEQTHKFFCFYLFHVLHSIEHFTIILEKCLVTVVSVTVDPFAFTRCKFIFTNLLQ